MNNILKNFIVLEGIDGAGTTTQVELLTRALKNEGLLVHSTCEPTDKPTGRFIRSLLKGETSVDPGTMAYLFGADRNEHIFAPGGVKDLCDAGTIVICDRYLFSSLAYQSIECDFNLVKNINQNFPLPEYLFFLELPVETAMGRLKNREEKEIYETNGFQIKVRDSYHQVLEHYHSSPMIIKQLNGTDPPEEILRIIRAIIKK